MIVGFGGEWESISPAAPEIPSGSSGFAGRINRVFRRENPATPGRSTGRAHIRARALRTYVREGGSVFRSKKRYLYV